MNGKYSSYLDILAASPLSRGPLLGVLSNPPTCREGLPPPPRLQRRKQDLREGLPKAPRGGGSVPAEPLPPAPTLTTVTLLHSHFPSLRVEIAVYPIFYEQVSREASRVCVIKPTNSKIQHLLQNLALTSHPPARL